MPVRSTSHPDAPPPPGTGASGLTVGSDETRRVLELLDRLDAELRATTRSLDAFVARLEPADGRG